MMITTCRVNVLEGTLAEKDRAIESLRKEVDELKMSKVETPGDVECQQVTFERLLFNFVASFNSICFIHFLRIC